VDIEKQGSSMSIASSVHSIGRTAGAAGVPVPPPPPPVQPPVQPPNARRPYEGARSGKPTRHQQQQQPPMVASTSPPANGRRSISPEAAGSHSDRSRGRDSASESLRGLLGINAKQALGGRQSEGVGEGSGGTQVVLFYQSSVEAEQQQHNRQGSGSSRGGGRRASPEAASSGDRPRTVYPRRPGDEKDKPKTVVAGKDVADPSSLHKGWLWSPSDEAAMRRKEAGGGGAVAAPVPKK
ncbi:hypothetical protein FOZ62_014290, partial [Perkinsus olseni]